MFTWFVIVSKTMKTNNLSFKQSCTKKHAANPIISAYPNIITVLPLTKQPLIFTSVKPFLKSTDKVGYFLICVYISVFYHLCISK